MAEPSLSFLVTYRGRPQQLSGLLSSLRNWYPSEEIVVSEQGDQNVFRQGQLFNLAYKISKGSIVVLMDVDIRLSKPLDFAALMSDIKRPFVAYNRILNCDESGNVLEDRKGVNGCFGGCCVLTREQFDESCGYSNLLIGWGGDDTVLDQRVGGFLRLNNTVLHIAHSRRKDRLTYSGNVDLCQTDKDRDRTLDGFRQTTARTRQCSSTNSTVHVVWESIGVVDDFAYMHLIRRGL